VSANEILTIALVLLVPSAALWLIFYLRTRPSAKRRLLSGIPSAMRPGPADEVLETRRLERLHIGGILAVLGLAIFIVAYWLPEAQRQQAFAAKQLDDSIHRGKIIFQPPPELPPNASAAQFKKLEQAISLGMGCANCHGPGAEGGQATYTDPATGKKVVWNAPPLNNVFQRWDDDIVRFTIEQGRPGTPMPTWGADYGGPMTEQMISDVMNWLHSLPQNKSAPPKLADGCDKPTRSNMMTCGKAIFQARCAVCHGPQGQGKDESGADYAHRWFQGAALWRGKIKHLTRAQQFTTITNGRRYAFMPEWGEAPPQGIPVPPNPLTKDQIRAVETYERNGLR
jgi:mono/diheme cytochrome c family protein